MKEYLHKWMKLEDARILLPAVLDVGALMEMCDHDGG